MAQRKTSKSSKPKLPKGWIMSGANPASFDAEIDTSTAHSGTRCAHMFHNESLKDKNEWGTLMQQMSPVDYLEQRLRMSLWVKTENVSGWVAPWMRVDGAKKDETLSFDNFCRRQIVGTTDWTRYETVLDVPKASTNLAFGIMLGGEGHLWLDDVSFEVVDRSVPTTDCPCCRNVSNAKNGVNLNFEDGEEDEQENHHRSADTSKWKHLKSLSASKEGKIKSIRWNVPVPIEIKNETNMMVKVYWIDYDGERQLKGTIEPSGIFEQETYESHPWLLTDSDDRGLAIFVTEAQPCVGALNLE